MNMRILVCGDVHWSNYSSILRRRGTDYSKRLENCINSINWVEQTAEDYSCDCVVYLGDWFDRSDLNSEEISALNEVSFGDMFHTVIVGNHELGSANGDYSTTKVLSLLPDFEVISTPLCKKSSTANLVFIPYIFERDRKTLREYLEECGYDINKPTIVFSHNDLRGVNYGAFVSKEGFDIKDITGSCDLFLNGHIHNGQPITDKIINVGNITGQNFNEDANEYDHNVYILDTETFELFYVTNPYAYNFYKEEVSSEKDISKLIGKLKNHSVVSVKCPEHLVPKLKEELESCEKIEEYRVVTVIEEAEAPKEDIKELLSADHLSQFREYILEKLGGSEAVLKELQEVISVN